MKHCEKKIENTFLICTDPQTSDYCHALTKFK